MARKLMKPEVKCIECGGPLPYQGRGRPRIRHVDCMTPKQKENRAYMKSYMPKYYRRSGNKEKHNEACKRYIKKKREGGYEG